MSSIDNTGIRSRYTSSVTARYTSTKWLTNESGRTRAKNGPPWWRPGAAAQRKVEDLIYEWRQARNWFLTAEECLGIALDWDMVADLAVRDESADAPAERRTARSRQLSKRSLAPSQQVEQDMVEAG